MRLHYPLEFSNDEKALLVKNRILESHPKASIKTLHLDLASIASIFGFVKEIEKLKITPIGLLNNAGIMNRHFCTTEDGFENTIGVILQYSVKI